MADDGWGMLWIISCLLLGFLFAGHGIAHFKLNNLRDPAFVKKTEYIGDKDQVSMIQGELE
jgi:hypothetical protein